MRPPSSSRCGRTTSDAAAPTSPPLPTPRRCPARSSTRSWASTLTDEQWECISAPLEPFVIVAGAGTGKTAVMAARVLWLVASGFVAEPEVLGLTFTNKAAAELAHRVTALLEPLARPAVPQTGGEAMGEPTIATYHSFARRLVDEQGLRVGIEPGARLLSGRGGGPAGLPARLPVAGPWRSPRMGPAGSPRTSSRSTPTSPSRRSAPTTCGSTAAPSSRGAVDGTAQATRPSGTSRDTAARRLELLDLVDELREARASVRRAGLLRPHAPVRRAGPQLRRARRRRCAPRSGWCSSTSTRTRPSPSG